MYIYPYCQFLGKKNRGFPMSVYTACVVLYGKEAANSHERPSNPANNPSKPLGHPRLLWFVSHGNLTGLQRTNFCPLPVWPQTQDVLLWTPVSDRSPCCFKLSASVALKLLFCPFHIQLHPFTSLHTTDAGILVPSILIALLATHHGIVISLTWTSKEGLSFYATLLKTVWWE